MKKKLTSIVLLSFVFILVSCSIKLYDHLSLPKDFIWKQIVLFEENDYTFDIESISKDYGIVISKYEYTINDVHKGIIKLDKNTITPLENGMVDLYLEIIDNKNKIKYYGILAKVVSVVPSKMIEVRTYEDLRMMDEKNSGDYILKSDIDLKGIDFEPIGNLPDKDPFIGMFINLGNYKIKNLTITSSNNVHQGINGGVKGAFFGATIHTFLYGLKLENINIDVSDFKGRTFSTAASLASSFVMGVSVNNHVTGNITGQNVTGGLFSTTNSSVVYNSNFEGSVTGIDNGYPYTYETGGLIGLSSTTYVENSSFFGEIHSEGNVGGIAGHHTGLETYLNNNNHFAALHNGKLLKELIGDNVPYPMHNWLFEVIIVK